MTTTFKFYADAGLTAEITSVSFTQAVDGSAAPVDRLVWLGSTTPLKLLEAASNPGVASILISVSDSTPAAGPLAAHVKLAYDSIDLNDAVAGAAYDIGASIASGLAHPQQIAIRVDTPALAAGVYTDLTLTTNAIVEIADV